MRSFEYRLPPTIVDAPWEMRRGLGGSFGYNRAERAEHLMSPRAIVALLTEVVAKGGHLLLSVGPDANRPDPTTAGLDAASEAGAWVHRHGDLVDRSHAVARLGRRITADTSMLDDILHAVDVDGSRALRGARHTGRRTCDR